MTVDRFHNDDEMEKNKTKSPSASHVALAIALFLVGGELLGVGIAEKGEMYSSGAAFLLACLVLGAAASGASFIFGIKNIKSATSLSHKLAFFVFGVIASGAAVLVALETATEFADFVENVMLLAVPRWIVFLLFLAFCTFLATRGVRTVKKFALVAAVTVGASAILLVLMSIPLFDLENLSLGGAILPDPTATAEIFVRKFAPLGVALAYFGCEVSARRETNGGNNGTYGNDDGDEAAKGNEPSTDNETDQNNETDRNRKTAQNNEVAQSSEVAQSRKKTPALTPLSAILGALLGGAFLILCYFNVMLLLGGESARGEEYPYSLAVGAISAGKLFMRMEAVSYAMYFLASTLRASVAVGLIWEFFKRVLVIRRETDG
jgi:hypothetical protein